MMALYRRWRIRSNFLDAREELYEKLIEELDKDGAKRNETMPALFFAWGERERKRNRWLASSYISIANKMADDGKTLSETLEHLVPFEERMVIWGGEQQGELVPSLHQALRIKRTLEEMKTNSRAAQQQPAFAAFNFFTTSFVMGTWAWPEMIRSIPFSYWPAWTVPSVQMDLAFAKNWPVLGLIVPGLYIYFYTLSRWTGKRRQFFDKVYPWSMYRAEQENVLLTTVAGLLNNKFTVAHACEQVRIRSTPYLRWHLNRIVPQITALGDDALKAFDTGLISRSVMDRLEDAKRTRDLDKTIQHVGDKALAATVRVAKRYAQMVSVLATLVFVTFFMYSAAVQLIGTQTASNAMAAKMTRGH
jgi:hypothetical protein